VSELLENVARNLRLRRLFRPGQAILVAVSGGLDSMVLLHLLSQMSGAQRWRLAVAHLNHGLRGGSSDADERLVRRTAKSLGLQAITERADVRQFARANGVSIEMAARRLRHEFLARAAVRLGIGNVALAHHADDQLELFFLRLLRGSGVEGLAGMKWSNPSPANPRITLVRPILDQPKSALRDYALKHRIHFREDATNSSLDIQRNRIRRELLPLLRAKYQPALDQTVLRTMEILGAEAEMMGECARQTLGGLKTPETDKPAAKARLAHEDGFARLPVALQRRCVQMQLLALGIVPDFELVEKLRAAPRKPIAVRQSPPRGLAGQASRPPQPKEQPALFVIRDHSGVVRVQPVDNSKFSDATLHINLTNNSGKAAFAEARLAWRLIPVSPARIGRLVRQARASSHALQPAGRASLPMNLGPVGRGSRRAGRLSPSNAPTRQEPPPTEHIVSLATAGLEFFDADMIGSGFCLRHWRPGDRFQPIGMAQAVKLQDWFTNQKIPRALRRRLLVAATAQGEVFWVEGARISERFKLTQNTIRCLQWHWQRC
jgi:tRNA(Ile)-lysidine synthetase-like protein